MWRHFLFSFLFFLGLSLGEAPGLPLSAAAWPDNVVVRPLTPVGIVITPSADGAWPASGGHVLTMNVAGRLTWLAPARAGVYPFQGASPTTSARLCILVYPPEKWVSREAFAYLLSLFLPQGAYAPLPELPADHWSAAAISQCLALDIMRRYPDGELWPHAPIRRIEAAKMLADFWRVLNRAQPPQSPKAAWRDLSVRHWGYDSAIATARVMATDREELYRPNDCLTYADAERIFKTLRSLD